jgi:predicted transcriptional regulator
MNPNDEIRHQILQYFYDRNSNATSRMGKKGSAVKISDAKRELKEAFGLKQPQVMSNLTYLIDNGWVKTIDIEKTVKVKGGTIPQTTTFYEISAKGIDKIEGGSKFEPRQRFAGININATGQNVITLGDGNVVNAKFADLHSALEELKAAVTESSLDESEKFDIAIDIENIKDQLAKNEPDKTIVRRLWSSLEKAATVSGVTAAYEKVAELLSSIIG